VTATRFWYPSPLGDGDATYRVSFRVGEEATWDHRFHDLAGKELDPRDLGVTQSELGLIQSMCDIAWSEPLMFNSLVHFPQAAVQSKV
jgi:hypothetical protein